RTRARRAARPASWRTRSAPPGTRMPRAGSCAAIARDCRRWREAVPGWADSWMDPRYGWRKTVSGLPPGQKSKVEMVAIGGADMRGRADLRVRRAARGRRYDPQRTEIRSPALVSRNPGH